MTHEYKLLSLMFDALNWVDHTDIFAHLEGCFGETKLKIPKTMLTQYFIEL